MILSRSRFLWLLLLLLPSLVLVADCAKTGDPQPPLLLIPKPAKDLSARQVSDQIVLSVSMPSENTDGSPVTTLSVVELLRVTGPRSDPGSVPEQEFLARAETILSVSAEQLKNYLHGAALVFRDELRLRDRSLIYSRTFSYAVRFINRKNQTAGLSNQLAIAPVQIPLPPAAISLEVSRNSIRVSWPPAISNMDGSKPPRVVGYNVYRTEDPKNFSPAPLNAKPVGESLFDDTTFQFGRTYLYAVSVVGSLANPYAESAASQSFSVTPKDTFPPGAPGNLNAVAEKADVVLLWAAPGDSDVAGYRIYRREQGGDRSQPLQSELVRGLSYRDENVQSGKIYVYSVTAVDNQGNEGTSAELTVEVK